MPLHVLNARKEEGGAPGGAPRMSSAPERAISRTPWRAITHPMVLRCDEGKIHVCGDGDGLSLPFKSEEQEDG